MSDRRRPWWEQSGVLPGLLVVGGCALFVLIANLTSWPL